MEPVHNVYKGGFFKNRHRLSWRAPIIVDALVNTYDLKGTDSIIDVGCGIGDYVKEFDDRGFVCMGIEGSKAAEEFFVSKHISIFDLRKLLAPSGIKYDLAFSLEVAEHISAQYADNYIRNLCMLSDRVLISAATPGQGGHGHVNCAPRNYWINKFKALNFRNMKGIELKWRNELSKWREKKEMSSYFKNIIAFERME